MNLIVQLIKILISNGCLIVAGSMNIIMCLRNCKEIKVRDVVRALMPLMLMIFACYFQWVL